MTRVGVLTAGGDSPGLNAAIRGFGKSALHHHGMEVIGFRDGLRGLAHNNFVPLDAAALSGILTKGGTMLGTSRDKVHRMEIDGTPRDVIPDIQATYEAHGLDALVLLGGGGTAKNARRLMRAGLNVVMLPKTIDNDIWGTDNSFGFGTALEIATEAVDRLHSTAHSHHRIILTEIMGHRAGWLALGSGLAGGADVILIPELPYHVDKVAECIEARVRRGTNFSVVAVAEGARDQRQAQELEAAQALVSRANSELELAAAKRHRADVERAHRDHTFELASQLEELTGLESRVTILGYVQRGGAPCAADRLLATRLGCFGAELIAEGVFGVMVATEGDQTLARPLEDVAGKVKYVPVDHPWLQTARSVGTGLGI